MSQSLYHVFIIHVGEQVIEILSQRDYENAPAVLDYSSARLGASAPDPRVDAFASGISHEAQLVARPDFPFIAVLS